MLKYGGGGHENAGTCQVSNDKADEVLQEIIKQL
jgi:nanoRNase/pAp phosphatase (c-di-AMP/oligoRNAs hydrolase)